MLTNIEIRCQGQICGWSVECAHERPSVTETTEEKDRRVAATGSAVGGVVLECETDFVARNEDFVAIAQELAEIFLHNDPGSDPLAVKHGERRQIEVMDLESRKRKVVTKDSEVDHWNPSLSPDGRHVVYHRRAPDATALALLAGATGSIGSIVVL